MIIHKISLVQEISVRPLFMHLYTDSIFADRYTDIKEILGDNVIDLTMIDRFIASEAMKNGVKYIDPTKGTKIEAVPLKKYMKQISICSQA